MQAQNGITLSWDKNSEDDLYLYRIYRATNPNATTQIDCVQHPSALYYDATMNKGVLYYYRVRAVDFSLNAGPFSDEINLAVPKISGIAAQISLPPDTTITINLDSKVNDPDDADETINWTITGNNNLTVNINNRVASIQTPSNWSGQETLKFKAADDEQFFDNVNMVVKSGSGSNGGSAPQFSTIPDQILNEDTNKNLKLSDFVTDSDSETSDLSFSVNPVNSITFTVNGDNLKIQPAANWHGTRTTTVTVSDNTGLSDETSMKIIVNSVNDAPTIADIPSVILDMGASNTIGLGPYVSDVDHNDQDLNYSFSNYNHVTLSFNETSEELTITAPTNWNGFEYVKINVTDPANASTEKTLVVRVNGPGNTGPTIQTLPEVVFNEDEQATLELNNYVTDPDDPVQNLFWNFEEHDHVHITVDATTNIATFKADENWHGTVNLDLAVFDPNQNEDESTITVKVNSVNDAPTFSTIPAQDLSGKTSAQLDLKPYTSDVDDNMGGISWSSSNNANVTININNSGVASIQVSDSWFGQEKLTLTVTDDEQASNTIELTVFRQNTAKAPVISGLGPVTFPEDNQYIIYLNNHVSDADNSLNELKWKFGTHPNMDLTLDNATHELYLVPNANWHGEELIEARVTDPDGNFDIVTMQVTVESVNDIPSIIPLGTINLLENTVKTIDLKQYIKDDDGFGDIVDIQLLGNTGFIGYFLDNFNFQLTFFVPNGFFGNQSFLLKVTDSEGVEATTAFSVKAVQNVSGTVNISVFGSESNRILSWETVEKSQDYIEFGIKPNGLTEKTDQDISSRNEHQHVLANLKENSTYLYRIVSESQDGNITYSVIKEFQTGSGNEINVFPIPFRANAEVAKNSINFTNLPENGTLTIYNLLAEPVFKIDELPTVFHWNVRNNDNKKISSGVYIYVIKNEKNKKVHSGKIVIIR